MYTPLVLVVEDEPSILEVLEAYLRREGLRTERAMSGPQAVQLAHTLKPDLVLLDIMLPGWDGLEVLQRIRQERDVRVILLTARSAQVDRLLGLRLGADDYVVKPFDPNEVVLRVRAVLRRTLNVTPAVLRLGDLEVHLEAMHVQIKEVRIDLTLTEFRLLEVLVHHPRRTFRREELLERCWEDPDAQGRTVDVHMGSLRRKLERHTLHGRIETVRGVGYRLWVD